MTQRPEARKVEEAAVGLVERLFNGANWQVNRFYRDFGIDLHIKVFEDTGQQQDTPWEFYVQVKGTKHLNIKKDTVGFPIDVDHLRLWSEVSLPILFIICDVTANAAYWLGVKGYVRFLSAADSDSVSDVRASGLSRRLWSAHHPACALPSHASLSWPHLQSAIFSFTGPRGD